MWNARVLSKVKVVAWCICKDIIPPRANIFRRHIGSSLAYVFCLSCEESSLHLMRDCPSLFAPGSLLRWVLHLLDWVLLQLEIGVFFWLVLYLMRTLILLS
ncbi:hypothetical protein ACFX2J_003497 [Malus domestica]